jgi:hypothetical protein
LKLPEPQRCKIPEPAQEFFFCPASLICHIHSFTGWRSSSFTV